METIVSLYIPNPDKKTAWLTKTSRNQVEYIRADVFIKESVQWLSDHVNDYIINDKYILPNGELSRDWLKVKADMFDDYKRYMEGRL